MPDREQRTSTAGRHPGGRRARLVMMALVVWGFCGIPAGSLAGRPVVGRIRGTIVDEGDRPLPGLMVQLSSRDDNGVLRVTGTDEHGRYLFSDLPAGIYEIVVGAAGYGRAEKAGIEVRPPFQNIVGFVMTRSGEAMGERVPAEGGAGAGGVPVVIGSATAGTIPTVPVRGRFLDKDRQGIPEVSVVFYGLGGEGAVQGFSGDDGTFVLEEVPVGLYRVIVRSPGHVALDLPSVEVAGPDGLNLSLSLVDYPLNSRERLGAVVLPRETGKPAPTPVRIREPGGPEHTADDGGEGAANTGQGAPPEGENGPESDPGSE